MVREWTGAGYDVVPLSHRELDITVPQRVTAAMKDLQPNVVINCSAYNAVDDAETEREIAFRVNADGPGQLADAAQRSGAAIVHYSSDFVFDGCARLPYTEDAMPNPLNVYGESKLAGERAVSCHNRHYILRVESLFGGQVVGTRRSTVDYLADCIESGTRVRAITDRTVSVSYVDDVVLVTRALLERRAPFGICHCVASGWTTWFELANEIAAFLGVKARVVPVRSQDFPTVARRPRFCALSNRKLVQLGLEPPGWRLTLARYLAERKAHARGESMLARPTV